MPPTQNTENLQIVPYGEEYTIPSDGEDTHSAATTEQMDEEIKAEANASPPLVSSKKPQPV